MVDGAFRHAERSLARGLTVSRGWAAGARTVKQVADVSFTPMSGTAGPLRVGLINLSERPDATTENFRRALASIPDVDLQVHDGRDETLPPPETYDAIVLSGSIDSVNDEIPYVHRVRRWVQSCDRPILGVCFGHQLLASAFGGTVAHMPDRELGYRHIEIDRPEDSLFAGIDERPVAFLCHEDIVVEPPPGATVLARNERGVQAFRLGPHVAVQFHPEIDREHARWLLDRLDLPEAVRNDARATLTIEHGEAALRLRRLFLNFLATVREGYAGA